MGVGAVLSVLSDDCVAAELVTAELESEGAEDESFEAANDVTV